MKTSWQTLSIALYLSFFCTCLGAQEKPDYADIPRIDVHAHVGSLDNMSNYMAARSALQARYKEDIAL